MDEFELIDHYFKRGGFRSDIPVGIGDDCAVVTVPDGHQMVFSMDSFLPNVHFFAKGDPANVGDRALRVALSDLAAMGADPMCCTLGLTIPRPDQRWLQGFSQGILRTAEQYECPLVGGDTTQGPMVITLQVHGTVPFGQALTRDGAEVGDLICVTGHLGDGAASLQALQKKLKAGARAFRYFIERYYRPEPRFDIARKLRGIASAAIDISDGLLADLGHICRASGVGAEIDTHNLPISEPVLSLVPEHQWLPWALSGGDDYQLCFTIPETQSNALFRLMEGLQLDISVIGTIVQEQGIRSRDGEALKAEGYRHFKQFESKA